MMAVDRQPKPKQDGNKSSLNMAAAPIQQPAMAPLNVAANPMYTACRDFQLEFDLRAVR